MFFLNDYLLIFILFLITFVIGGIIILLPLVVIFQENYNEKVSPYECGFSPFEETRTPFDIHFYLVAILFVIFDLEISYLFPWSLVLANLTFFGFWAMIWFLIILSLGFVYEWNRGALNWT